MPLQDVSEDQLMINWLRQAGHGHLIEDHHPNHNVSPPIAASMSAPAPTTSLSSPPLLDHLTHTGSFQRTDHTPPLTYGRAGMSPPSPPPSSGFNQRQSPLNFDSPPSAFISPNMNDQQLDHTIEVMKKISLNNNFFINNSILILVDAT